MKQVWWKSAVWQLLEQNTILTSERISPHCEMPLLLFSPILLTRAPIDFQLWKKAHIEINSLKHRAENLWQIFKVSMQILKIIKEILCYIYYLCSSDLWNMYKYANANFLQNETKWSRKSDMNWFLQTDTIVLFLKNLLTYCEKKIVLLLIWDQEFSKHFRPLTQFIRTWRVKTVF